MAFWAPSLLLPVSQAKPRNPLQHSSVTSAIRDQLVSAMLLKKVPPEGVAPSIVGSVKDCCEAWSFSCSPWGRQEIAATGGLYGIFVQQLTRLYTRSCDHSSHTGIVSAEHVAILWLKHDSTLLSGVVYLCTAKYEKRVFCWPSGRGIHDRYRLFQFFLQHPELTGVCASHARLVGPCRVLIVRLL